jgi:hypothetical protein
MCATKVTPPRRRLLAALDRSLWAVRNLVRFRKPEILLWLCGPLLGFLFGVSLTE